MHKASLGTAAAAAAAAAAPTARMTCSAPGVMCHRSDLLHLILRSATQGDRARTEHPGAPQSILQRGWAGLSWAELGWGGVIYMGYFNVTESGQIDSDKYLPED